MNTYHCLLRTTRLHEAKSTTTLRTIALGRICFEDQPTSWIVVLELRGQLFALRSDSIAQEELLVKDDEDCDDKDPESIPAASLPKFEEPLLKATAVFLGGTEILEETEILEGRKPAGSDPGDGGRILQQVTEGESGLVDA